MNIKSIKSIYPEEQSALQENIVLFGARTDLDSFINSVFTYSYGLKRLRFIVDNDPKKWGKKVADIEIHPPDKLLSMNK